VIAPLRNGSAARCHDVVVLLLEIEDEAVEHGTE